MATVISKTSIYRTLKKHKFHVYKTQLVKELKEVDQNRRMQFLEEITQS